MSELSTPELSTPDRRMIELMEYAIKNEMAKNEGVYWAKIGFPRTSLAAIRRGVQSFRIEHITNACLLTGASADWVLGIDENMFRQDKPKTGMQLLKEATRQIEKELKGRSTLSALLF